MVVPAPDIGPLSPKGFDKTLAKDTNFLESLKEYT